MGRIFGQKGILHKNKSCVIMFYPLRLVVFCCSVKLTRLRDFGERQSFYIFFDVFKIAYDRVVYKIPYRRARAWPVQPLGRVRARAKVY